MPPDATAHPHRGAPQISVNAPRWRWLVGALLIVLTGLAHGCGREHCDQLVRAACAHLEERSDGADRCEQLKILAESVDDDQCKENLRILKESGKLQNQ